MRHTKKLMALVLGAAIAIAPIAPVAQVSCLPGSVMIQGGSMLDATYLQGYDQQADDIGNHYGEAAKQAWISCIRTGDFGPFYAVIGSVSPTFLNPEINAIQSGELSQTLEHDCYYATGCTGTVPYLQVVEAAKVNMPETYARCGAATATSSYAMQVKLGNKPALTPTVTTESIKASANTSNIQTSTSTNDIAFDAKYYASHNPDLAAAGIITDDQLYQHWITYGKKEGRKASATQTASGFDAKFYASHNPDLAAAGIITDEQLYQHWITFGQKEGRKASAN